MKMKTKLIIATSVPGSLASLLKGQPKYLSKSYDVTLISSPGKEINNIKQYENVPVKSFKMSRQITLLEDLITLIKLTIYFSKTRPKIVHSYTPKAGLLVMFASYLSGVPHRFHSVVAMPLMEAIGFKKILLILTERITYLFSTKLFCNSKILRLYMANNLTNRPITVIWNGSMNGIDTKYYKNNLSPKKMANIRKKVDLTENNFIIMFVGRIVKDKGIDELIEAFINVENIHPEARLLLIGDYEEKLDPISERSRNYIEKRNTIINTGFKKDIREYLSIANLFILPSYREGLPHSLLEASCYNIPLIASNINGCNEIIEDRETGILIPPKNVEALTNAICELIDDKYLCTYLSSNLRNSVKKRFSQKIFYKHLIDEYNKEINRYVKFKF